MEDFIYSITGGITLWRFVSYIFFAGVGALLNVLMDVDQRDVQSEATPKRFSYKFFLADNYKRIFATIILIYVVIRFSTELNGQPISEFMALMLGLNIDRLTGWAKKKFEVLKVERDKFYEN